MLLAVVADDNTLYGRTRYVKTISRADRWTSKHCMTTIHRGSEIKVPWICLEPSCAGMHRALDPPATDAYKFTVDCKESMPNTTGSRIEGYLCLLNLHR
jgi:hypothetical protein